MPNDPEGTFCRQFESKVAIHTFNLTSFPSIPFSVLHTFYPSFLSFVFHPLSPKLYDTSLSLSIFVSLYFCFSLFCFPLFCFSPFLLSIFRSVLSFIESPDLDFGNPFTLTKCWSSLCLLDWMLMEIGWKSGSKKVWNNNYCIKTNEGKQCHLLNMQSMSRLREGWKERKEQIEGKVRR